MIAQHAQVSMKQHPTPLPLPPAPTADGLPHVHVVNSDPDFLEMIAELLSDSRVRVTLEQMRPNVAVTADNLRSARPDLLLLDVVPFRNDADLLLGQLEADEEMRGLPVLLASTTPGFAERVAERHAEVVRDIVAKPFEVDDLLDRLGRLLNAPV
jgi:DNA-binding response OmpR family regulator